MKIYSALLGNRPRIHRDKREVIVPDDTPFHSTTLSRQLRRATGHASRALDEARERLHRATGSKPVREAQQPSATIVLIGRAASSRRKPPVRSAAAA